MAKQELPVDFKDDVLQAAMAGKRRYRVIQNEDGTISLDDVTEYSQIGNSYGAAQMNATNMAVNESFDKNKVIDSLDDIAANESAGYAAGALAVRELNGKSIFESGTSGNWKYNKWSNGDVELWYEGILPFANKTDAGLSGIFMTIANVSLPFQIKNGVTFASLKWAYTEWCTSYLTNDNRVQIRKFSNANSAGITDQRCAIYVKGKY